MHLQDFDAVLKIRTVHQHLAVKPARTQQRGIEHLRRIRSGHNDHAL